MGCGGTILFWVVWVALCGSVLGATKSEFMFLLWFLGGVGLNVWLHTLIKRHGENEERRAVEESQQARQRFIEEYRKLGVEDILLHALLTDWQKKTLLQEVHHIEWDEAEELVTSAEQAKRKAKLGNIKRSIRRKTLELHGGIPVERREPIPEDVMSFVWGRDNGKCVKCGSNENLEFDHVIPIAKGGSNTARNLQLLCESCNRAKSDTI